MGKVDKSLARTVLGFSKSQPATNPRQLTLEQIQKKNFTLQTAQVASSVDEIVHTLLEALKDSWLYKLQDTYLATEPPSAIFETYNAHPDRWDGLLSWAFCWELAETIGRLYGSRPLKRHVDFLSWVGPELSNQLCHAAFNWSFECLYVWESISFADRPKAEIDDPRTEWYRRFMALRAQQIHRDALLRSHNIRPKRLFMKSSQIAEELYGPLTRRMDGRDVGNPFNYDH